jgi:hypothetical protein
MKQRVTRALFEHWDALRGARPAPDRNDIDPGAIRSCLANTFVLAFDPDCEHPFRIAGTAICALFGRELTRSPFVSLWAEENRNAVLDLVRAVAEETEGAVASVTGRTGEGEALAIEMILLPLADAGGSSGRLLGALAPVAAPYWLGERPLRSLHLGELRYTAAGAQAGTTRRLLSGRANPLRGPGFVVYPAASDRRFHGNNQG